MPKIEINEIDNTIYGRQEVTSDNIVFIPGTAITGPSEPTLIASQTDFKSIFGSKSPDNSSNIATAWDYANNLLMLGMPVLFKRITGPVDGETEANSYVTKASSDLYSETEDKTITTANFNVVYIPAGEATAEKWTYDGVDYATEAEAIAACEAAEGNQEDIIYTPAGEASDPSITVTYTLGKDATDIAINIATAEGTSIYNYSNTEDTPAGLKNHNISLAGVQPASGEWIDPQTFINGEYTIEITAISDSSDKLVCDFTKDTNEIILSEDGPKIDLVKVATVKARYGGTYGNTLNYTINISDTSCYFRVYSDSTLIESQKVASLVSGEPVEDRNKKLLDGLKSVAGKFNSIEILDINEENFTMSSVEKEYLSGGADADEDLVATQIPLVFSEYKDKLIYDIKFITSGGYTDTESSVAIASAMIDLAESRGDCLAIVDIELGLPEESVINFFNDGDTNSSYGTAYAPWCYTRLYDKSEKWCAPSYIFLNAIAKSINSGNPIYLAPAGVKRAQLTNVIDTEYQIGSAILDKWQQTNPTSVNPIMNIHNYGYVIYGQRTLYSNVEDAIDNRKTSALQELSVRIVSNEIKKLIYKTALYLTFDQNNLYTWNEFKSMVTPALNDIKSNGGINDYVVKMDETTITDDDINTGTIRGSVIISVTRTAENFSIDFILEPSSVTFEEDEFTI